MPPVAIWLSENPKDGELQFRRRCGRLSQSFACLASSNRNEILFTKDQYSDPLGSGFPHAEGDGSTEHAFSLRRHPALSKARARFAAVINCNLKHNIVYQWGRRRQEAAVPLASLKRGSLHWTKQNCLIIDGSYVNPNPWINRWVRPLEASPKRYGN